MCFHLGVQDSPVAKPRHSHLTSVKPVGPCRVTRSLLSDQWWRGEAGESLHWSGKKSVKSWHTHTAFHTEREEASKNIKHSQECSYSFSFCLYVAYFYFIFSIRLVSNIIHKLGQKYVSSSYAQLLFGNASYHKVFFLLFCAFISIPAVLPPRSLEIYHSNYWDIYYALNDTPAN